MAMASLWVIVRKIDIIRYTIERYKTTAQSTWGINELKIQAGDKIHAHVKKSYGAGAARARKALSMGFVPTAQTTQRQSPTLQH